MENVIYDIGISAKRETLRHGLSISWHWIEVINCGLLTSIPHIVSWLVKNNDTGYISGVHCIIGLLGRHPNVCSLKVKGGHEVGEGHGVGDGGKEGHGGHGGIGYGVGQETLGHGGIDGQTDGHSFVVILGLQSGHVTFPEQIQSGHLGHGGIGYGVGHSGQLKFW